MAMASRNALHTKGHSTPSTQPSIEAAKTTPKIPVRGFWSIALFLITTTAAGFWLFANGFLLTRMVLPDHSLSKDLPYSSHRTETDNAIPGENTRSNSHDEGCSWYPAKFDRSIVLVVDALRIDFAAWSQELNDTISNNPGSDNQKSVFVSRPYHNGLPFINKITNEMPENSMLYRFRADPPTTTLQRLKGLTTGQLPTFIDAGSNFAGSMISEDNWLQALRWPEITQCESGTGSSGKSGRKRNLVFLGDDTWSSMFPNELADTQHIENNEILWRETANNDRLDGWARIRPFPSLNVWDLDTVDDGVLSRLPFFLLPPPENISSAHGAASNIADREKVERMREEWRNIVVQKSIFKHPDFSSAKSSMVSDAVGYEKLHSDWDFIVGHCLGVDHCGHRFGSNHPAIRTKLKQINKAIELIVEAINRSDKSTVLYVFGDHGMDPKGDHGGDSPREVDAALWIYSNKKWNTQDGADRSKRVLAKVEDLLKERGLDESLDEDLKSAWWENTHLTEDYPELKKINPPNVLRSITQIDLVSSLTLTLGLPIPFNNLGAVIPEMFASENTDGVWGLLRALRLNAAQTMRYLNSYMENYHAHGFSKNNVHLWTEQYERAEAQYRTLVEEIQSVASSKRSNREDIMRAEESAAAEYYVLLRVMLGMLRQMWAQFDQMLIVVGLTILVLSAAALLCTYFVAQRRPLESLAKQAWGYCLVGSVCGVVAAKAVVIIVLPAVSPASSISPIESAVAGASCGSLIAFCYTGIRKLLEFRSENVSESVDAKGIILTLNIAACIAVVLHCLVFLSNSFTFNEDSIMLFLVQSLTIVTLISSIGGVSSKSLQSQQAAGQRALICSALLLLLNRISSYSTVCREEKLQACILTFYGSPSSSVSTLPVALANAGMVWFVPFVIERFLARSRSEKAITARLWVSLGMRVAMGLSAVYWILDTIDANASHDMIGISNGGSQASGVAGSSSGLSNGESDWSEARIILARTAIGIILGGGLTAWMTNPFCLDVEIVDSKDTDKDSSNSGRKKTRPKGNSPLDGTQKPRQAVLVLGFGNAYGAAYLIFATVVFCILYMVQQPMGGIMLSMLFIKIIICAELFDSLRDAVGTHTSFPLLPAQLAMLALFSFLDYFTTGHQFTFASIQWSTAFIGVREMQMVVCGLIVSLNTLGSFILTAACLPLVVFWNESLSNKLLQISPSHYVARIASAACGYIVYHALVATSSAACAAWFRRHLMVWKVFAPRFVLTIPVLMVSMIVTFVLAVGFAALRLLNTGISAGGVQHLVTEKLRTKM